MTALRLTLALATLLGLAGCITEGGREPRTTASPVEAAEVNLQLGAEYLRKGDLETALTKLQKAVDLNPKNAQAQATLALAFERLGLNDEAKVHYRKAIRESNKDPVIDNLYGAYLCRNDRLEEAQEYLLRAARNPRYGTPQAAYTNAGVCALRMSKLDLAEEHFREALRIDPSYADALWQMADLSYTRERDLQARAFLQRLNALGKLPPTALWLALRVESRLGDEVAVARYAEQLKRGYPDSRETALLLELERDGG